MSRPSLVIPLLVGGFFGAVAAQTAVKDTDFFWHLATGQQTLAGGLARTDVFSWTVFGERILTDQWLGDVMIALAYAVGSWSGVIAVRALAVAAVVALTLGAALHARPGRPLIAVLASLPAIALSHYAWTDRPELFGYAMFAALVWLVRLGQRGSGLALAATIPLLVIWSNLHGSSALGVGVVTAVCLERAISVPSFRSRAALLILGALAATLVTPSGIGIWTSSSGHFLAPPRFIQEEGVPDLRSEPGLLFAVTLGLVLTTALLGRGGGLADAAILVPVAFVSLTATRHLPFFAIAAAPFLAADGVDALGSALRLAGLRIPVLAANVSGSAPRAADFGALVASGLILAAGVAIAPRAPDVRSFPQAALATLPPGPGLLNRYEWGGFLIWYAPATPVFVDGRLFPYVGDTLDDYRSVIGLHPDWREVLARRGIRAVLVGPSDAIAVRAADLGWPVLVRTEKYVLLRVP